MVNRYSDIIVDSVLAGGDHKKAATVSLGSLAGIVAAESLGLKPYQVRRFGDLITETGFVDGHNNCSFLLGKQDPGLEAGEK